MDHLIWKDRPTLRDPVLVAAFTGWNDAGQAASAALGFLVEHFHASEVARIDPEEFYDFTAVRPTVRLDEGRSRVIEWPTNDIYAAHVPTAERDLVLMQGAEPSLRWGAYCSSILTAARELRVGTIVTLGALLADVPHTRPVAITGLASDESLIERLGFRRSSYEGPTGIVGVLHDACTRASLPSASFWASVPHYIAAAPNPKAALALIRRFEGMTGMVVDASELEEATVDYERQVSAAVSSDPEVRAFVEELEESMDEAEDDEPTPHIPSADALARDFQRFLRQRGPGEAG